MTGQNQFNKREISLKSFKNIKKVPEKVRIKLDSQNKNDCDQLLYLSTSDVRKLGV